MFYKKKLIDKHIFKYSLNYKKWFNEINILMTNKYFNLEINLYYL